MSGTLLLISKSVANREFEDVKKSLKQKIPHGLFSFQGRVKFRETATNSLLIEFRKNEETKFFQDKDGNWLTFEGVVFALARTQTLDASELLRLYFEDRENFPNKLDGHFVIKLYDAREDKYIIINDFIKNKTNFVCETDDYLMVTPFSVTTSVIKHPELDLEALNEFLWRYYILSDRSLLKGVSRLKPASVYQFGNNYLSRKTYWEWPAQYSKIPFDQAVAQTADSMKESARLIAEKFGKPCIDFTMGQDTRQVISAFTNQKINFTTSIFGKPDFYEVQKIKEIARKLDVENLNIQLHSDYTENLWKHFKDSILLGSCEEPGYLIGRLIYMRKQQSKLANVSLNGMDGHFYKNGLWDEMYTFNFYREPKKFNINAFLNLRAFSNNFDDSIFRDEFLKVKANSQNYFKKLIEKAIAGYEDSPVSIQVDRFDLYHWLNFTTVSNNSGNLIHNSISPLLLRRNLELALQIPVQWKFNLSKFQRALVYKLDPELAKIKTDFAGVNMVPKNIFTSIPFYTRYFYFQSSRLRKKILTKLGIQVKSHLQEAWDYKPLYIKLSKDNDFKKLLEFENMQLKSILKNEEWNNFLKRFDQPEDLNLKEFEFLFKIASVEYFMKVAEEWKNN